MLLALVAVLRQLQLHSLDLLLELLAGALQLGLVVPPASLEVAGLPDAVHLGVRVVDALDVLEDGVVVLHGREDRVVGLFGFGVQGLDVLELLDVLSLAQDALLSLLRVHL